MKTSVKVRRLLAKGIKPIDIAKKLNIKASYVHTIKWLDSKKKKKEAAPPKKAQFKSPRSKLIQSVFQTVKDIEPQRVMINLARRKDGAIIDLNKGGEVISSPDLVNHPPHYKTGGIETIDFIEAKDLNYRLGNVVKYVSRAGKKDTDPVQDLEKALFYLKREIEARKSA